MVFDLGRAMQKKEEFESARLMDFEFRRRVRTIRLVADALGIEQATAIEIAATTPENEISARIATLAKLTVEEVAREYQKWLAVAHEQLVSERGDPTPHRLG